MEINSSFFLCGIEVKNQKGGGGHPHGTESLPYIKKKYTIEFQKWNTPSPDTLVLHLSQLYMQQE